MVRNVLISNYNFFGYNKKRKHFPCNGSSIFKVFHQEMSIALMHDINKYIHIYPHIYIYIYIYICVRIL